MAERKRASFNLLRLFWRKLPSPAEHYKVTKIRADKTYGIHTVSGTPTTLGSVTGCQTHERGITVICQRGALRLSLIAPDCLQVRLQSSGKFPVPFSYAVAKVTWPEVPFTVSETDEAITLVGPEFSCRVSRQDSCLTVETSAGHIVSQDASPLTWREGEIQMSRALPSDEACFGLAAQPTKLDLRGKRYILWNNDPHGFERDKVPSHSTVPFYLGVHKNYACGLLWDNPSRGWVDVGAQHKSRLTFNGAAGELRYYLFMGVDLLSVLNRYTELTGRMPLPPLWALGFHLSRWSYYPADKVRDIAQEIRRHNIPCDALYLDIDYMDGYRCFTWDQERFPAPAVLLKELADQGFKIVTILDPGIKADPTYRVYQNGVQQDVFLKYPDGELFVGPCWPGDAVFPDFTSPKVRAWWASQFETLFGPGVDGIWNDMNEPVIFSSGNDHNIPDAVQHDFEGQGAAHLEAHNVYGMLMGRASREALEKARPKRRPFNIIRAAHAGAQRYASFWTGDNRSNWDHMRLNISMVINSGLSGMVFNGADVGGFNADASPELLTRWIQLGAVMPFFRLHTCVDTAPQEPWVHGKPYSDINRKYIELRYQLLPYIYSLMAQSSHYGWPVLRPLFMADPTDDRLRGIEDTFMVGDAMLVAPVLEEGQTERRIVLPRGRWFDFHTNQALQGGHAIQVQAPLDNMPIFIRAGQVLPLWPVQQFVGQVPLTELRLKVYAGDGEVALYEDQGEGMEYHEGMYRWLYFTTKILASGNMSIDWRRAGKFQPSYNAVRCEVVGIDFEPKEVQLDGAAAPLWYYERGVVEFTANKPFERARIIRPDLEGQQTLMRSPLKDRDR